MNKTILITGGSRGIGAATAIMAASKGYTVCVNYIKNRAAADDVVRTIADGGGSATAYQADVSEEAQVKLMFEKIVEDHGGIHALVNNAGILETQMKLADMDVARLHRVFNNNILSYFLCAKEAISFMATSAGGSGGGIVNVSSIAAKTGSPGEYIDYAATKGAIDTFTIGLAKEVAEEGIRVNAVRPGFIYTDIHAAGGEPGRVDRVKDSIPLKRGGTAEEVAAAILWLLSDEASFTTGSFLDVSGGK